MRVTDMNKTTTGLRRPLHLVLVVLLMFATSCAKYTRYPQWTWSDLDCSVSERWKVQTREKAYLVHRFTTTDSTVVIEEFSEHYQSYTLAHSSVTPNQPGSDVGGNSVTPITLSFDQVTSIERIDKDYRTVGLVGLGVLAIVAILTLAYYAVSGSYEMK